MTTPRDDAPLSRSIELEVEVPGTPEEVWRAIATGPGISAWLNPTEVEERAGGSFSFDMGAGPIHGEVTGWDPPRRFVQEAEWRPAGEAPPARLATEWRVEARGGGTCVVRMVMSGFGTGAAWDDELDNLGGGMRGALEGLRAYLLRTAAAGPRSLPRRVMAGIAVADHDAAVAWYARLMGRPADARPMGGLAEWHVPDSGVIQVVEDADRAGRSLLTLAVDHLGEHVAALGDRGLRPQGIDDRTSDAVIFASIDDPEGNRITLVEARAAPR